jgi:hypothetical protein
MGNPIKNAVIQITKRELVTCKRCGCTDLAWVKYKSGKSGLVQTAVRRPLWRGEGPAPEGIFALKFNYHNCDEYREQLAFAAETVRLSELSKTLPHPKAEKPSDILTDAVVYLFRNYAKDFQDVDSPVFQAVQIMSDATKAI